MNWAQKRLADVVELRRGFDLPHPQRRDGVVPVLSAGQAVGRHDTAMVKGPGFAIGRATNLGAPVWSDADYWPLNTTLYAADFKGNDPRFLYWLFQVTDLTGYDSGSVQPMLNRNYIAKVEVPLPPVGEQRAIAEVVGALDDAISANDRLIGQAEDLSVVLAAQGSGTVPLAEIAKHVRVTTNPQAMGDTIVDHYSLPAYDTTKMPERVRSVEILSGKFRIGQPSVLLSKLNPRFPRVWDVATASDNSVSSTEFVVLESHSVSTSVLWALLCQPHVSEYLCERVSGTSGSHQRVKPQDVMRTPVCDPSSIETAVQDRITGVCAAASAKRRQNQALAALRDALLPELMSGRIRVKDAQQRVEEAI